MVTLDQELWNMLFGWLGPKCMLPEGCTVPISGILAYVAIIIVIAAVLNWRNKLRRELEEILEKAQEKV